MAETLKIEKFSLQNIDLYKKNFSQDSPLKAGHFHENSTLISPFKSLVFTLKVDTEIYLIKVCCFYKKSTLSSFKSAMFFYENSVLRLDFKGLYFL